MSRFILMLEHDEDDRYLTSAIFSEMKFSIPVQYVFTSEELYESLSRRMVDLPSLILLNQNLMPEGAVAVLERLKSSENWKHIPVIILAGYSSPELIHNCYAAGAASVILKPDTERGSIRKITLLLEYWFEAVELTS